MKYVAAVHKLTGENVNLPVNEISDRYRIINGIQFNLPEGTKPFIEAEIVEELPKTTGDDPIVEGFEFNGKAYKTEAAMKSAITRAKKKDSL